MKMNSFIFIVLLLNVINIYGEIVKPVFSIVCDYDSDCVENAFCKSGSQRGTCECKDHFILQTNKTKMECLPHPAKLEDPCIKDIQCHVAFGTLSHCKENKCQCHEDAHIENEGWCYKSGKLGSVCSISQECYAENANTYCERGICVCHWLATPANNGTTCILKKKIGEACDSDEQCTASSNNTRCHGVCRCEVNYVISNSTNITRCIQAADQLQDTCEEDQQCTEFLNHTQCIQNKCECKQDYHEYGKKCWRTIYNDMKCEEDNECKIGPSSTHNTFCMDGVCCIDGILQLDEKPCLAKENAASNISSSLFISLISLFCFIKNS